MRSRYEKASDASCQSITCRITHGRKGRRRDRRATLLGQFAEVFVRQVRSQPFQLRDEVSVNRALLFLGEQFRRPAVDSLTHHHDWAGPRMDALRRELLIDRL